MRLRPAKYDLKKTFEMLEEDPHVGFFVKRTAVFLPELYSKMSLNIYPKLETIGHPVRRYVKGNWYSGPVWESWLRLCLRDSEDPEATLQYVAELIGPPSHSKKIGPYMGERSSRYDFLVGHLPEPQRDPAPHLIYFHFPNYLPSGERERAEFSGLGEMKNWIFYPVGCYKHWDDLPEVQAAAREKLVVMN